MGHPALPSRFLHVTSVEVGARAFHIVARCDLCELVAERRVDEWNHDCALDVVGLEALAERGCKHVNEAFGSGVRPAFSRRA